MSSFPAPSALPAADPVWLVLVSAAPGPAGRCEVVLVNAGNGVAHQVTVRHVPVGGLGPVLAEAPTLAPEAEMHLYLDRDATGGDDALMIEWVHGGRRRRRLVDLDVPL